jgi:hypothetical protein
MVMGSKVSRNEMELENAIQSLDWKCLFKKAGERPVFLYFFVFPIFIFLIIVLGKMQSTRLCARRGYPANGNSFEKSKLPKKTQEIDICMLESSLGRCF